jgi:hypothetical protein
MERLLKIMHRKWNISAQLWNSKNNRYNGEETECKNFAAKDTAKERYHKYCKLD